MESYDTNPDQNLQIDLKDARVTYPMDLFTDYHTAQERQSVTLPEIQAISHSSKVRL